MEIHQQNYAGATQISNMSALVYNANSLSNSTTKGTLEIELHDRLIVQQMEVNSLQVKTYCVKTGRNRKMHYSTPTVPKLDLRWQVRIEMCDSDFNLLKVRFCLSYWD